MAARAGLNPMPDSLWPSWGDTRVTAIVPMASDSYLFDQAGLAKITIPMMAVGGTIDTGTPYDWGVKPAYDYASSAQKSLVTIENAEHPIFMNTCNNLPWLTPDLAYYSWVCFDPVWDKARGIDLINHFTTAFLLDVLKGDRAAHAALAPESGELPRHHLSGTGILAIREHGEGVQLSPMDIRPGYVTTKGIRLMKRLLGFFVIFGLLLLLSLPVSAAAQETVYYPTTAWRTSTPEAQGIDSAQLTNFLGKMATMPDAFHSIVVIRHGYVVLDTSMYPFSSSKPQAFRDTSEPIMVALIGIAIDQGFIKGVDQSIWEFLPKDQIANMNADKAALTIQDFLTHRSGLTFFEGQDFQKYYPLSGNDPSWLQTFLGAKLATKPGTDPVRWFYGDGLVLSAILQKATGMTALDFAQRNLFGPLGITDVTWLADPQGITIGIDEIYLSPMDMAKIAYLYLHNGQWAGQQIVSQGWVQAATSRIACLRSSSGALDTIGYGWTVGSSGQNSFFVQLSQGGEHFGVFPDQDLIFIVTGDAYYHFLADFPNNVLQTIGSAATLPENAEALAALNAQVEALANPAPHNIAALPETFSAISGKTFTLQENAVGWQTLAVDFGAPGAKEATLTLGIDGSTVKLDHRA